MEIINCTTVADWESWPAAHHAAGRRLAEDRQEGFGPAVGGAAEATEAALCYGWIDSHRKSCDGEYFVQKYSPRRRGSSWSQIDVERAAALIAAGRMRAPGLAQIEAAKTDGRWEAAYQPQRTAPIPRIWQPHWRATTVPDRSSNHSAGPTGTP